MNEIVYFVHLINEQPARRAPPDGKGGALTELVYNLFFLLHHSSNFSVSSKKTIFFLWSPHVRLLLISTKIKRTITSGQCSTAYEVPVFFARQKKIRYVRYFYDRPPKKKRYVRYFYDGACRKRKRKTKSSNHHMLTCKRVLLY